MTLRHLVFLALLACSSAFAQEAKPYPFSVESLKDGDGYRIVARNNGPAPISVKMTIPESNGIVMDGTSPVFAVVEAGEKDFTLMRIRRANKGVGYKFRTQSFWMVGQLDATQSEDAAYRLPFANDRAFYFGQVPGGPLSTHNAPSSRYAVDIPMPLGTPIVAVRSGVVVTTEAEFAYGALTPDLIDKANEVRILHEDGTIATYGHFAYHGVSVEPGQYVTAGTQIGLSGSTGYSSGPHLHLAIQTVERVGDDLMLVSLPFQFVNGAHAKFSPRQGMLARADYSAPKVVVAKRAMTTRTAQGASTQAIAVTSQETKEPPSLLGLLTRVPALGWVAALLAALLAATVLRRKGYLR